jgi:ABC-type nickel/cobalt efflux system permease component RcnA
MTTIDHWVAGVGRGGGVAIALLVALLLGLRHATDPDHLTAVSALALSDEDRGARRAGTLGLSWGLGHATTLVLFGIPALLLRRFLPEVAQHVAEALIGIVIIALAGRLLYRWRHGYFHSHPHQHGEHWHSHPHMHVHARPPVAEHHHAAEHHHHHAAEHHHHHAAEHHHHHAAEHVHHHAAEHVHHHEERLGRSPLAAYGIGLIHGIGGSAAVTLLLIGAIPSRVEATFALIVFALATALSMSLLSAGFGTLIASRMLARRLQTAVPLLGLFSLALGVVYALAAASVA